ncbi:inorganic phosphate transporter [Streptomyces sp. PTM05]|uniref:Phosphate transporter n=1 Tax=Streptantibioticus parmotrematis TaxID=2873249 RepID=A0ABS7R0C0_9ACTN|nr:inorganic phosphate transporter [Streptantibioticus parmotrematis]MBY8887474.1 inorganic phosphate transporter [Streptantibioticus parmotrematis]
MEHLTLLIGVVIVTALAFDFTNGFHDTANAMATTISTGAMSPRLAVAMSAVLNLAGAFLSVQVAKTISGGIIDEKSGIRPEVIFAGLVGAIVWNLVTWLAGLPSSSSHALFGGLIGATLVAVGAHGVHGEAVVMKVLIPAVASPLVAGAAAALATRLTYRIGRNADPESTRKGYRAGQIASAGLVSLAHGTNDAQKTMGVITLALITGGIIAPGSNPPVWVILSAGTAMALGTYIGGWRIIRTLGKGLTDVQPQQGFAAQSGAATVILASSHLGFALSTTHVVSGAVLGSGVGRKGAVVRWGTAGRMGLSWLITLPAAGLVAAGATAVADQGTWGVGVVGVLGLLVCAGAYVLAQRNRVDHTNVNDVAPVGGSAPLTPAVAGAGAFDAFGGELAATIPAPAQAAPVTRKAAL